MNNHEIFALSLGGALIIPETEIRTDYLRLFSVLIKENVDSYQKRFGVVTGGGNPCRVYQRGYRTMGITDQDALDWVGIDTTHLNAKTVHYAFLKYGVRSQYLKTLEESVDPDCDAWVTGGTKPGQTSDAAMISFAQILDARTIINATNVPYIYEMTGGAIDRSKPIPSLSWTEYFTLIGPRQHIPGENLPFGYTASKQAQDLGLTVVVLDGNNLDNFNAFLQGKPFNGTSIHP